MTNNILQNGWQFFSDLFDTIGNGILFFGGPYDIFLTLLDIAITTILIYFILKLIRDSRAWQLLKGIILIVIFSQIAGIMGLQTIGYMLTNTLSVIAIALVVLFQPELRRALETVGRNSFSLLSGVITQEIPIGKNALYSVIDAIVRATEKMAETKTGALIIIERETKLGELAEQDNAVIMDSAVSSPLLLQIFYKGSPLHDGAVLIRNGRINAARCHVPLSDNYHLRKDYGTRHRAAIGASEMGDAIAVVVSEERGIVSIAIDGRLYTLDNADALRAILHKQMDTDRQGGVLTNLIKNTKIKKRESAASCKDSSVQRDSVLKQSIDEDKVRRRKNNASTDSNSSRKKLRSKKFLMMLSSLLVAIFIWLYVQIMVNPVESKTFSVPLTIVGLEDLNENGLDMDIPVSTIAVTLRGRSKNLDVLDSETIVAYIDVSGIKTETTQLMPISVKIKRLMYFETTNISPSSVSIDFSTQEETTKTQADPSASYHYNIMLGQPIPAE